MSDDQNYLEDQPVVLNPGEGASVEEAVWLEGENPDLEITEDFTGELERTIEDPESPLRDPFIQQHVSGDEPALPSIRVEDFARETGRSYGADKGKLGLPELDGSITDRGSSYSFTDTEAIRRFRKKREYRTALERYLKSADLQLPEDSDYSGMFHFFDRSHLEDTNQLDGAFFLITSNLTDQELNWEMRARYGMPISSTHRQRLFPEAEARIDYLLQDSLIELAIAEGEVDIIHTVQRTTNFFKTSLRALAAAGIVAGIALFGYSDNPKFAVEYATPDTDWRYVQEELQKEGSRLKRDGRSLWQGTKRLASRVAEETLAFVEKKAERVGALERQQPFWSQEPLFPIQINYDDEMWATKEEQDYVTLNGQQIGTVEDLEGFLVSEGDPSQYFTPKPREITEEGITVIDYFPPQEEPLPVTEAAYATLRRSTMELGVSPLTVYSSTIDPETPIGARESIYMGLLQDGRLLGRLEFTPTVHTKEPLTLKLEIGQHGSYDFSL
jgi:hypothetical protein